MHHRIISLAGGAALVVVLAACGGGGSNPTTAMPGPFGEPPPTPTSVTAWRSNPSAEDLRDHWNDPETITERLRLAPVEDPDARKRAVAMLITSADADPGGTGTKLRNVSIDGLTIVGEQGGITYGQWKTGPAGTLNIEFDYRFAPGLGQAARARMERAGKAWSRRLQDDFPARSLPGGTIIEHTSEISGGESGTFTFDENVPVDDMLIAVLYTGTSSEYSSGGPKRAAITTDDYEPWLGTIVLSARHANDDGVMAHEIGHVIGIVDHTEGWDVPTIERYMNYAEHTFEGPASQRANGGQPVPFQWLNEARNPVGPHTAGATVDYGHPGACESVMAYCRDHATTSFPTELDFAYLADIGYELLDAATAAEPEVYGFGAWARYSAWGAGVERELVLDGARPVDRLRAGADAFGTSPNEPLAGSSLQGDATWTGSLIGVDLGSAKLPPVAGDAGLRIDLATLDGTATFERLTVHPDGASHPFRAPSLEYAIAVTNNAFSDEEGRVHGGFFGPAHEEMAGVLHDPSTAVNLLAGFGGSR